MEMSDPVEEIESTTVPLTQLLERYGSYPFDTDEAYKQGLASLLAEGIIGSNQLSEVQEEALRRTRVFYFNSITGSKLSVDDVRDYERSRRNREVGAGTDESAKSADETRILTFAELQELIETGKVDQIPNNKTIPDALNVAPPSNSTAPVRKKPWETTVS